MIKSIYRNVANLSAKTALCLYVANSVIPVFLTPAYAADETYTMPYQRSIYRLQQGGMINPSGELVHFNPSQLNKMVISEREWNEMNDRQRVSYVNKVERQFAYYSTASGKKALAKQLDEERKDLAARTAKILDEHAKEKLRNWRMQQAHELADAIPVLNRKYAEEQRITNERHATNLEASQRMIENLTETFFSNENEIKSFLKWKYGGKLNFLDLQGSEFKRSYLQFMMDTYPVYNFTRPAVYTLGSFISQMASYAVLKRHFAKEASQTLAPTAQLAQLESYVNEKLYNPERYPIIDGSNRQFLFPEALRITLSQATQADAKNWQDYRQQFLNAFEAMSNVDLTTELASSEEKERVRSSLKSRFYDLFGNLHPQDEWLRETFNDYSKDPVFDDLSRQAKSLIIQANRHIRFILDHGQLSRQKKNEFIDLMKQMGVLSGDIRTGSLNPIAIFQAIEKDKVNPDSLTQSEARLLDLIDASKKSFLRDFNLTMAGKKVALMQQNRVLDKLIQDSKLSGNMCFKFYGK